MYGFQEKCKNMVKRFQSPLVYMVDCPSAYLSRLSKCYVNFIDVILKFLSELCFQFKVANVVHYGKCLSSLRIFGNCIILCKYAAIQSVWFSV